MRMFRLATAAALVAAIGLSGAAFAGEGNGNPFPYRSPGVVTTITPSFKALPPGLDDPFPYRASGTVVTPEMAAQVLPANGSEAPVQTANSLPAGFSDGTSAYAQAPAPQSRVAQHRSAATPRG